MSDENKNGNGDTEKSFKQSSDLPASDHSLTQGYIKKATDSKVIRELHEVQDRYNEKSIQLYREQRDKEINFLKGTPQEVLTLPLNQNRLPNQEQKDIFYQGQEDERTMFQLGWENKAKRASEGKEWRDDPNSKGNNKPRSLSAAVPGELEAMQSQTKREVLKKSISDNRKALLERYSKTNETSPTRNQNQNQNNHQKKKDRD